MNKQAEFAKNPFTECCIDEVCCLLEPRQRHTAPHENRFSSPSAENASEAAVMQKFNSDI